MEGSVLVICPQGGSGEIFAARLARELDKLAGTNRIGFSYPYLPEYRKDDPALLQQAAAVVRDGMVSGVAEFLFADTGVRPVIPDIMEMLPVASEPVIYDVVDEAKANFPDPQERPVWLDRWEVSQTISGFKTLYSLDRKDLRSLVEEVVWRTRGVTGGNMEKVKESWKKDIADEEVLRNKAVQLLLSLAEIPAPKGILLANIDLAAALTRYIDEEYREYIHKCQLVTLAEVLAARLI